jgi:hypothetical protein
MVVPVGLPPRIFRRRRWLPDGTSKWRCRRLPQTADLMAGDAAVRLHDIQPLQLARHIVRHIRRASGPRTGSRPVPVDRGVDLRRCDRSGEIDAFACSVPAWLCSAPTREQPPFPAFCKDAGTGRSVLWSSQKLDDQFVCRCRSRCAIIRFAGPNHRVRRHCRRQFSRTNVCCRGWTLESGHSGFVKSYS